jgi:hypothetical protein
MLANVLKSDRATKVSILVVRAFVQLRAVIAANRDLAQRVDELHFVLSKQIGRHDKTLKVHDLAIRKLLDEIRRLTRFPELQRREIGFTARWK